MAAFALGLIGQEAANRGPRGGVEGSVAARAGSCGRGPRRYRGKGACGGHRGHDAAARRRGRAARDRARRSDVSARSRGRGGSARAVRVRTPESVRRACLDRAHARRATGVGVVAGGVRARTGGGPTRRCGADGTHAERRDVHARVRRARAGTGQGLSRRCPCCCRSRKTSRASRWWRSRRSGRSRPSRRAAAAPVLVRVMGGPALDPAFRTEVITALGRSDRASTASRCWTFSPTRHPESGPPPSARSAPSTAKASSRRSQGSSRIGTGPCGPPWRRRSARWTGSRPCRC